MALRGAAVEILEKMDIISDSESYGIDNDELPNGLIRRGLTIYFYNVYINSII